VALSNSFIEWITNETRSLDIVASWETLCNVYKILEFTDDISDMAKLEEFKWIIREMNKHLTRARKKLLSTQREEDLEETLRSMYTPSGQTTISSRRDLAYHKLRQRWIDQMIINLNMMMMEEDKDGSEQY